MSENVRFKIGTVVLLGIQVFWDSPVVMEFLECLKLMAVCSFKMPSDTLSHPRWPESFYQGRLSWLKCWYKGNFMERIVCAVL